MTDDAPSTTSQPTDPRIADLERDNAALAARLADSEAALTLLRKAYTRALEQLQLLQRRIFMASAERVADEQLAFQGMFDQVHALAKALDAAGDDGNDDDAKKTRTRKTPPKGRRDLAESDLPIRRVEILDDELEGKAERIMFEETSRLGYERGGPVRVVVARAIYKVAPVTTETPVTEGDATPASSDGAASATTRMITAPLPKELFRRTLLVPSMIAHFLVAKYLLGVPFYRLEQGFALQGFTLDRGTMCRYAEDVGATLGAIVLAARDDAMKKAFCLSTDATGVRIQPGSLEDRARGPCRKGHFFVVLADRDHVFFEYQERHTSAAVCEMFKGYSGYLQADAHAVYDALFAGRPPRGELPGAAPGAPQGPPPTEVGCWSHCRRHFWEAAVSKNALGVEGLRRIAKIFGADRALADLPPSKRKEMRSRFVRPLVEDLLAWVEDQRVLPHPRGYLSTALGYAHNQAAALRRFLDDGRLKLENNAAERALRPIASARKSWLFFGSDDHAEAAANLFSLVASCKLHGVDPESYLADVMRVMPYWPRERYLELCPRDWAATRARLVVAELEAHVGAITVPAAPSAPEEKAAS